MRGQLQWMGILALFFLLSCGSKKDAYFPDDTNDPNKEAKAFFNKRHNNGMNDPNSIYGVWKKNVETGLGQGEEVERKIQIFSDQMYLALKCTTFDPYNPKDTSKYRETYAGVRVKIVIRSGMIYFLESANDSRKLGFNDCQVQISSSDQVAYRIYNSKLNLGPLGADYYKIED